VEKSLGSTPFLYWLFWLRIDTSVFGERLARVMVMLRASTCAINIHSPCVASPFCCASGGHSGKIQTVCTNDSNSVHKRKLHSCSFTLLIPVQVLACFCVWCWVPNARVVQFTSVSTAAETDGDKWMLKSSQRKQVSYLWLQMVAWEMGFWNNKRKIYVSNENSSNVRYSITSQTR